MGADRRGDRAKGEAASEAEKADLLFGRAFMERTMPETALRLARIQAGADTIMAIPAAAF